jgi:hypothetical protein
MQVFSIIILNAEEIKLVAGLSPGAPTETKRPDGWMANEPISYI